MALWQFLACSKISEQSEDAGQAEGSVRAQVANRKLYRYSVIPGGVYSVEELARARRTDRVVAAHYADFSQDAGIARLSHDELVYVSYRKADKVYWTQRKHRVCAGEAIVTDGKNTARARCGNRLSKTPMLPVDKTEPKEAALGIPDSVPPYLEWPTGSNNLPGLSLGPDAGPAVTGAEPGEAPRTTTGAGRAFPPLGSSYQPVFPVLGAGPLLPPDSRTPGGVGTSPTSTSPITTSTGTTTGAGTPTSTTTPVTTTVTTPGTVPSPVTSTPEPQSLLLLFAGALSLYGLRTRRPRR